jgi:hypothetical protein
VSPGASEGNIEVIPVVGPGKWGTPISRHPLAKRVFLPFKIAAAGLLFRKLPSHESNDAHARAGEQPPLPETGQALVVRAKVSTPSVAALAYNFGESPVFAA